MKQEQIDKKTYAILNDIEPFDFQWFKENIKNINVNLENKTKKINFIQYLFNMNIKKKNELNIQPNEMYLLLKKADLNKIQTTSNLLLVDIFLNKQYEFLSKEQFLTIWNLTKKEIKQMAFKKIVEHQVKYGNSIFYFGKINNEKMDLYDSIFNFILYDLQLELSENTIKWLKRNASENLLKKVEKNKVFIDLHKQLNISNKTKNNNRIKI